MSVLDSVQIILSHPQHPGNIGAVARAMKTMGLKHLTLVNPKDFPHAMATARASGADDILSQVKVTSSLKSAILGCHYVLGTSARTRAIPWPLITAHESAQKIANWLPKNKIAILFGNERSGLSNEELALCQFHVTIPTHPDYSSLNLAFSVQILAYEIFQAMQEINNHNLGSENVSITSEEYALLFERLEHLLVKVEYLDLNQPKHLMKRLKRLVYRGQLNQDEFHILMGVGKAILHKIN